MRRKRFLDRYTLQGSAIIFGSWDASQEQRGAIAASV